MKTLLHTSSGKYFSQKAYERWLAGRDPQDMPLHEAWTSDSAKAASMDSHKIMPMPDGCKIHVSIQ